jgi:hypothetical protein
MIAARQPMTESSQGTAAAKRTAPLPRRWPVPRWLLVVGLLTAAWIAWLALLVGTTANPVTLNRVQMIQADYVVTARPVDRKTGSFQVEREWKQQTDLGTIRIHGLPDRPQLEDRLYLIPLTRHADGSFTVTQGELLNPGDGAVVTSHVPPAIYPATDDALRQLARLLPPP